MSIISKFFLEFLRSSGEFFLDNHIVLSELFELMLKNLNFTNFFVIVFIQPIMFGWKLVVDPVDLIYLVFKFKSETDLLIKWLFSLLEVFHQNFFLVFQVFIFLSKNFQFLKYFWVLFLINLVVVFYNPLTFFYFLS